MGRRKPQEHQLRAKRSRTRSGCFTCRDRHMKCDEQLPVCQNCINSKRKCYRGIRLNFTQYTIYDPHKSLSAAGLSRPPKFFRLLDQLIAVLAQYKDGRNSYRKYLHLHNPEDLEEAELRHLQDMSSNRSASTPTTVHPVVYNADPIHEVVDPGINDAWFFHQGAEPVNFSENTILESFDIKNLLMNPVSLGMMPSVSEGPAMNTTFEPMVDFSSQKKSDPQQARDFSSVSDPGLVSTPFDSYAFVKLIQDQRYYWILDLFNEIDVWKSIIPSYCVRIVQAESDDKFRKRNPSFLLDCLMDCKEFTSMDRVLHNARQQLNHWKEFDHRDVTATSFKGFEQVLLSIVLILLSMILQVVKPTFLLTESFNMVLANQGKMIRKVVARYERFPEALVKTMAGSLMSTASLQAIVILRFLLKKHLQKIDMSLNSRLLPVPFDGEDVLRSTISYDSHASYELGEFFTLTPFEVGQVATKFQDFDINEIHKGKPSDAAKLRNFFWSLVEFENFGGKGDLDFLDSLQPQDVIPDKDTNSWALRPSDKCIALNILAAYLQSTRSEYAPLQNTKLHEIFNKINTSTTKEKANWTSYFRWTLNN
ncbi:CIC11C00000003211 [Sungouiella intermedia]|uniref:CIC11C00000003211 n=1 Tax=Sungouiella intermedia TaxID=45354 RepID=A0A1L0BTT8_9ASCO|nr:CIC11C00000003211 [[Candida] intermedia]